MINNYIMNSLNWHHILRDRELYNSLVLTDQMLKATQSKPELKPYNPGVCATFSLSAAIVVISLTSMINN